jgi:hypothetical protein
MAKPSNGSHKYFDSSDMNEMRIKLDFLNTTTTELRTYDTCARLTYWLAVSVVR